MTSDPPPPVSSSTQNGSPPPPSPTRVVSTKIRIAVGTENPSKLKSVQTAWNKVVQRHCRHERLVELQLQGVSVDSGVPHQPFGDEETKRGAVNRARAAFAAYTQQFGVSPHFGVGLEGGLEQYDKETTGKENGDLWCMAWMAVCGERTNDILQWTASSGCVLPPTEPSSSSFDSSMIIWGVSKTSSFALPWKIAELVLKEGMELGHADDQVFSRIKAKHGSGTVGLLTDDLIDRSAYYEHALMLALIPWIRPDVYPHGNDV